MHIAKRCALVVLTSAFLAAGLGGCDNKSGATPGEQLDKALDKTGEKVKEAGEAIKTK